MTIIVPPPRRWSNEVICIWIAKPYVAKQIHEQCNRDRCISFPLACCAILGLSLWFVCGDFTACMAIMVGHSVNCEYNRLWRKSTERKFNRIYLLFFLSTSNVDRLNHYIPVPDIDRIPYLFIVSFFFLFHFLIFCSIFFCFHFCRPCTRQIKKKTRHNRRNDGKNDIIAIKMCSTCLRGFAETFHN